MANLKHILNDKQLKSLSETEIKMAQDLINAHPVYNIVLSGIIDGTAVWKQNLIQHHAMYAKKINLGKSADELQRAA